MWEILLIVVVIGLISMIPCTFSMFTKPHPINSFVPPELIDLPETGTCEHCGQPVRWDEWFYVHEDGMADCSVGPTAGKTHAYPAV